ncbi:hypothetical protein [Streptomyces sp. NPDC048277]|uniref:hypothetical protein n=1 Tax=Streptomyces sp. NPDC048277 TaxID=3155027 RepID=UPI0033E2BA0D
MLAERIVVREGFAEPPHAPHHHALAAATASHTNFSVAGLPFAFPFPFPTSATSLGDDGMRSADPCIALLGADGPEHRDARRALVGEFTPRRMTTLEPRIQRVVDDHVDEVSAGPRRADLVRELALPVLALGPSARSWEFRP